MAHNPFSEFAAKVQALPDDLRAVATREFVAGVNFDVVPKIVLLETVRSLPAVKTLCILVTGEDVVSPENYAAAFPLLFPFIQRVEIVCNSLEEANRLLRERRQSTSRQIAYRPARGRPASARRISRGDRFLADKRADRGYAGQQSLCICWDCERPIAGIPAFRICRCRQYG